MKRIIVSISRQYASGGEAVAKALGAKLGIPVYERQVIELAAQKAGLTPDYIDSLEENASRSFLFNLVTAGGVGAAPTYDVPLSFSAYSAQAAVIKELAAKGSCVIVGRCGDYILRDDPDLVRVFISADDNIRVKRVMERFSLTEREAEKRIRKLDKGRANYYLSFTGEEWGAITGRDLVLNTSALDADSAADVIIALLKALGKV